MESGKILTQDFYVQHDVVAIARKLVGKVIHTSINGQHTSGIISETEAYSGAVDRASHAYGNRRTRRTETLFGEGGRAYVYLCYGIHHLFNVVTNVEGIPHAVLLRGIFPESGIAVMERRRGKPYSQGKFTDGPGKVSKALGIHTGHDGTDLTKATIWIEDAGIGVNPKEIITGPRVGVDYAGEDAFLPYRFVWMQKKPPL